MKGYAKPIRSMMPKVSSGLPSKQIQDTVQ